MTISTAISGISSIYIPNTNKFLLGFVDHKNRQGKSLMLEVNGNNITFGEPVIFNQGYTDYISVTYIPSHNKAIIAYTDYYKGKNYGKVIIGTINGNSISFGTPVVFNAGDTDCVSAIYIEEHNKLVIGYESYNDNELSYCAVVIGDIKENTISFGNPIIFNNSSSNNISMAYNSHYDKLIIGYNKVYDNIEGCVIIGTINGNSISFGDPIIFNHKSTNKILVVSIPSTNKVGLFYSQIEDTSPRRSYNGGGYAIIADLTSDRLKLREPIIFTDKPIYDFSVIYNNFKNKVNVIFDNNITEGKLEGDSISFTPPVVFNPEGVREISGVYNPDINKLLFLI